MCQITFNLPKQNNLVTVEVQSEFPTEITWKSYQSYLQHLHQTNQGHPLIIPPYY